MNSINFVSSPKPSNSASNSNFWIALCITIKIFASMLYQNRIFGIQFVSKSFFRNPCGVKIMSFSSILHQNPYLGGSKLAPKSRLGLPFRISSSFWARLCIKMIFLNNWGVKTVVKHFGASGKICSAFWTVKIYCVACLGMSTPTLCRFRRDKPRTHEHAHMHTGPTGCSTNETRFATERTGIPTEPT